MSAEEVPQAQPVEAFAEMLRRVDSQLRATRQALDELHRVRHTALSSRAHAAYERACALVLDDLYEMAEAVGLSGSEITSGDPEEGR